MRFTFEPLPPEREEALLSGFDECPPLDVEEELLQCYLTNYAFYRPAGRHRREWLFSCCNILLTDDDRDEHDIYTERSMRGAKHNDSIICPFCSRPVIACAIGRLKYGNNGHYMSLYEHRNLVVLHRHGDGIAASAMVVMARWRDGEPDFTGFLDADKPYRQPFPVVELTYSHRRRYYIGKDAVCVLNPQYCDERGFYTYTPVWRQVRNPASLEPFPVGHMGYEYADKGQYIVFGMQALSESALRYSGAKDYFAFKGDGAYLRGLMSYLIHYTKYPQMEMLARMQYDSIIDDLLDGCANEYDWAASTPYGFFKLSKAEFNAYRRSKLNPSALAAYRAHCAERMSFEQFCSDISRVPAVPADKLAALCAECSVGLHQAVNYLIRHSNGDLHRTFTLWSDYIRAARRTRMALDTPELVMPKALNRMHDEAVSLDKCHDDGKLLKQYRRRLLPALKQQYAFELDGLLIKVPESAAEIVTEGRVLYHCVGGYAERHIKGRTTILFLRKADEQDCPYVTIEINDTKLVQVHGYHNDIGAAQVPRELHSAFFDAWLRWLSGGSQRDAQGNPVLVRAEKVRTA